MGYVWLDNDSDHVLDQAYKIAKVWRMLSGTQVAHEVGLSAARERYKYSCPSCQSTDAMQAYPALGRGAHCFSCWTNFTAVNLAAAAWGLSPADACRRLAERFGIDAEPRYRNSRRPARQTLSPRPPETFGDRNVRRIRAEVYGEMVANLFLGPQGRAYMEARGLDPDFALVQGIRSIESPDEWIEISRRLAANHEPGELVAAGFAYEPDNGGQVCPWLPWRGQVPAALIPYYSRTGQIEAIRFRRMTGGDRKYMVPLRAGARIPWHAEAVEGPDPLELVVTEGELDALSLVQAGYEALALGGATPSSALLDWVVEAVANVAALALWTDADAAGDGAADRLAQSLARRYGSDWVKGRVIRWRSQMDANDRLLAGQLR